MSARRKSDDSLAECLAFLAHPFEHTFFRKARVFERDDDVRSMSGDDWMLRGEFRALRRLLDAIRELERRQDYSAFDVSSLSIEKGDSERTWFARCVASVERWLADNRD